MTKPKPEKCESQKRKPKRPVEPSSSTSCYDRMIEMAAELSRQSRLSDSKSSDLIYSDEFYQTEDELSPKEEFLSERSVKKRCKQTKCLGERQCNKCKLPKDSPRKRVGESKKAQHKQDDVKPNPCKESIKKKEEDIKEPIRSKESIKSKKVKTNQSKGSNKRQCNVSKESVKSKAIQAKADIKSIEIQVDAPKPIIQQKDEETSMKLSQKLRDLSQAYSQTISKRSTQRQDDEKSQKSQQKPDISLKVSNQSNDYFYENSDKKLDEKSHLVSQSDSCKFSKITADDASKLTSQTKDEVTTESSCLKPKSTSNFSNQTHEELFRHLNQKLEEEIKSKMSRKDVETSDDTPTISYGRQDEKSYKNTDESRPTTSECSSPIPKTITKNSNRKPRVKQKWSYRKRNAGSKVTHKKKDVKPKYTYRRRTASSECSIQSSKKTTTDFNWNHQDILKWCYGQADSSSRNSCVRGKKSQKNAPKTTNRRKIFKSKIVPSRVQRTKPKFLNRQKDFKPKNSFRNSDNISVYSISSDEEIFPTSNKDKSEISKGFCQAPDVKSQVIKHRSNDSFNDSHRKLELQSSCFNQIKDLAYSTIRRHEASESYKQTRPAVPKQRSQIDDESFSSLDNKFELDESKLRSIKETIKKRQAQYMKPPPKTRKESILSSIAPGITVFDEQSFKDSFSNLPVTITKKLKPKKPAAKRGLSNSKKKEFYKLKKTIQKNRRNNESINYGKQIRELLNVLHPDLTISFRSVEILNDMLSNMCGVIATEASLLAKHSNRVTLNEDDIKAAVRLLMPGKIFNLPK